MKTATKCLRTMFVWALCLIVCQVDSYPQAGNDWVRCDDAQRSPHNYRSKYNTIAHSILDVESCAWPISDSMYNLVDEVIDEAKSALNVDYALLASSDTNIRIREAVRILYTIDTLLSKKNFVYPAEDLVDWFHDGLSPKRWNSYDSIRGLICQSYNYRRTSNILKNWKEPFYVVDCDLTSFLYLAIGEVLNLPMALVEAPRHNFIAYMYQDARYVFWETMDARRKSINEYMVSHSVPEILVETKMFLRPMSRNEVTGYVLRMRAWEYKRRKQLDRSVADYRLANQLYRTDPRPWNELAWLYAIDTTGVYRNLSLAVEFADSAIALFGPEEGWHKISGQTGYRLSQYLDTRAAAYSNMGMYEEAIRDEERAVNKINASGVYTDDWNQLKKTRQLFRCLLEHYRKFRPYDAYKEPCDERDVQSYEPKFIEPQDFFNDGPAY